MKIKFLSIVAGIALLAACNEPSKTTASFTGTNGTTTVVVPNSIQSDFAVLYPNASNVVWYNYDVEAVPIVDWELNGWNALDANDYVVQFDMDNEHYYGWYDSDGTWIGSAYVIKDYKTLPEAVNNVINNQYPGYTITNVSRQFQKNQTNYQVQLKNGDSKVKMLIDSNGNIIKQKNKVK